MAGDGGGGGSWWRVAEVELEVVARESRDGYQSKGSAKRVRRQTSYLSFPVW